MNKFNKKLCIILTSFAFFAISCWWILDNQDLNRNPAQSVQRHRTQEVTDLDRLKEMYEIAEEKKLTPTLNLQAKNRMEFSGSCVGKHRSQETKDQRKTSGHTITFEKDSSRLLLTIDEGRGLPNNRYRVNKEPYDYTSSFDVLATKKGDRYDTFHSIIRFHKEEGTSLHIIQYRYGWRSSGWSGSGDGYTQYCLYPLSEEDVSLPDTPQTTAGAIKRAFEDHQQYLQGFLPRYGNESINIDNLNCVKNNGNRVSSEGLREIDIDVEYDHRNKEHMYHLEPWYSYSDPRRLRLEKVSPGHLKLDYRASRDSFYMGGKDYRFGYFKFIKGKHSDVVILKDQTYLAAKLMQSADDDQPVYCISTATVYRSRFDNGSLRLSIMPEHIGHFYHPEHPLEMPTSNSNQQMTFVFDMGGCKHSSEMPIPPVTVKTRNEKHWISFGDIEKNRIETYSRGVYLETTSLRFIELNSSQHLSLKIVDGNSKETYCLGRLIRRLVE